MKETIQRQVITPKQAEYLLSRNPHNRPIKKQTVKRLAAAMVRNEFAFNGDPIRVDVKGNLLDGQHRLSACVKSGKSFETLIISDLPTEVMTTIDVGDKRTYANHLSIRGVDGKANYLASATHVAFHHKQSGLNGMNDASQKPTYDQLDDFLEENPGLIESVDFITKLYSEDPLKTIARGIAGGLHYIFTQVSSRERADQFFTDAYTGLRLEQNDPVWVLRGRLLKSKTRKEFASKKDTCQLIIKAWNAEAKGKKIKGLTLSRVEGMPKVVAIP